MQSYRTGWTGSRGDWPHDTPGRFHVDDYYHFTVFAFVWMCVCVWVCVWYRHLLFMEGNQRRCSAHSIRIAPAWLHGTRSSDVQSRWMKTDENWSKASAALSSQWTDPPSTHYANAINLIAIPCQLVRDHVLHCVLCARF